MRRGYRALVLALLGAGLAFAAMDGTVVNKTTGKALAGASVVLVKPGQGGMRTLGTTTTGADGRFAFTNDEPGGGPQLLQVNFEGVNYNKLMTLNLPTTGVEVDVYEATKSPEIVHVSQRMMVFDVTSSQIGVSETALIQNSSDHTYNNAEMGAIRFYLPPSANGQARITAQGPQGMPLPRPAERTDKEDIFKVGFAIKPGDTEIQISYVLPVGSPFEFQGEVVNIKGMNAGPLRLVAPTGVTFTGKDIQEVGVEPTTQAAIYNVVTPRSFRVSISGTGSLNANKDAGNGQPDDESEQVTDGAPQIYTHLGWLLGLMFAILGVGFVILFRASPVRS